MNDEIKEILDYYKKDAEKFEYLMKDYTEEQLKTTFSKNYQRYKNHKLLLDYITNLQQENEKNKEYTEFYKDMSDKWKDMSNMFKKSCDDYKSRCEKASEKIHNIYFRIDFNNLCNATWVGIKLDVTSQGNELLNILQNGSEENDTSNK